MKPSSLRSLLSLASFALIAFAPVAAGAQPFPFERARMPVGAIGPHYYPVAYRSHRAPRPAPVVVVVPRHAPAPAPCVVAPPPPSDEHGLLVLDSTPLVGGQSVLIEWGVSYYPGQVVAVNADGTVRVHYSSYDGMWDENVARYRLRLPR